MAGITNARAIILCDSVVDSIDAGSGPGLLRIYTGTAPATDAAATGTLLAELTMSDPAFGAAADINPGARATANAITQDSSANASGTAGYARIVDSDENGCLQLSVGVGSGELQLSTLSIVAGQPVQVTSLTVTMPES